MSGLQPQITGKEASVMTDLESLGRRWLAAFTVRDFDQLERLLDPEVRFRALIPRGLREASRAADAVLLLRGWFGDSDVFAVGFADVDQVSDRIRIHYRVDVHEEGAWYTVDQTLYGVARDDVLMDVTLACSGFRAIDAPVDLEPTATSN
jgi:hypothetical protein